MVYKGYMTRGQIKKISESRDYDIFFILFYGLSIIIIILSFRSYRNFKNYNYNC